MLPINAAYETPRNNRSYCAHEYTLLYPLQGYRNNTALNTQWIHYIVLLTNIVCLKVKVGL